MLPFCQDRGIAVLELSEEDIAALEEPYRPHPIEFNR